MIEILWWEVTKTGHFPLGYLMLPKPIYLASSLSDPQAMWDQDAGGDLYLNMGPRATYRYDVGDGPVDWNEERDESFVVRQVEGDGTRGTIEVVAFGRTRRYENVTAIYADGGTGDDMIYATGGVLLPVHLTGGQGSDALIHEGNGAATLLGDGAVPYAPGTPDNPITYADYILCSGNGAVTIEGGHEDDYIIHAGTGTATIHGNNGNDVIIGGPGNETLYGDAGDDEMTGGGGANTIYAGAGDDLIKLGMQDSGTIVYGTGDAAGQRDYLAFAATDDNDQISLTSPSAGRLAVTVVGEGSITTQQVEDVTIDSVTGADSITVGNLTGSGVSSIGVRLGKRIVATGATTTQTIDHIDDDNNPATPADNDDGDPAHTDPNTIEVPVLEISPDYAQDIITFEGTAGNDIYLGSSVNPAEDTGAVGISASFTTASTWCWLATACGPKATR